MKKFELSFKQPLQKSSLNFLGCMFIYLSTTITLIPENTFCLYPQSFKEVFLETVFWVTSRHTWMSTSEKKEKLCGIKMPKPLVQPYKTISWLLMRMTIEIKWAQLKNIIFFLNSGGTSPVPELSFFPAPYRGWTRAGERRVILDSSFARPGSAPIWGGKKVEFRNWTRAVRVGDNNSKAAQYANQFVHSIDFDHVTIVDRARNFHERLFLEAWYSQRDSNAGNEHIDFADVYISLA